MEQYNQTHPIRLTNPQIVTAREAFLGAPMRVLLYGQETGCWGGEFSGNGVYVPDLDAFTLAKLYAAYHAKLEREGGQTPMERRMMELKSLCESVGAGFIALNVAPVGYEYGYKGHDHEINELFKELKIAEAKEFEPNLVVLHTGPDYDEAIERVFGPFTTQQCLPDISTRKLAKLSFSEGPLGGVTCYRCYHPGFLNRNPNEPWAKAITNYINNLIFNLKS